MSCNTNCNVCRNMVISTSVTLLTVGGVDNLVINIPAPNAITGAYANCRRFCLIQAQVIPTTVPIGTPVSISIGGDTTTVYPLIDCRGARVVASQLIQRGHWKYLLEVVSGVSTVSFKALKGIRCAYNTLVAGAPAAASGVANG